MPTSYWTGKKRSEETRRKISESQKGKKPNPKSILAMAKINRETGKSRQSYNYREWRRLVLERDNGKCVKCYRHHEKMHCHHIIPWKENEKLRFSVENGETLCASCHMKIGRENREIDGTETQFKKGISPRKGIKTGKPSWNSGKKLSQEFRDKLSVACKKRYENGLIPWNKGKPMSEEIRKKISESKKGSISHNKGKSLTEETKEKCRLANLGKSFSPKTQFKKGLIPWNKGMKKEQNPNQ